MRTSSVTLIVGCIAVLVGLGIFVAGQVAEQPGLTTAGEVTVVVSWIAALIISIIFNWDENGR